MQHPLICCRKVAANAVISGYMAKKVSVIGTYGANIKENESFFYFSQQFNKKNLAVPEILAISDDKIFYLQEDFGDVTLLNHLEKDGFTENVYDLFKKSLEALADLQVKGDKGLGL